MLCTRGVARTMACCTQQHLHSNRIPSNHRNKTSSTVQTSTNYPPVDKDSIHPVPRPGTLDKAALWRVTERNPQACGSDVPPPSAVQMYRQGETEGVDVFVNRNPRNSELLNYKDRELGWSEDQNRVPSNYYNRIVLERSNKHVTARLIHFESGELVSVSTREPWIKSRLASTSNRDAALTVGRVLAHRMKSMGVNCAMFWDPTLAQFYSSKTEAFLCGVKMEGVKVSEHPVDSLSWSIPEDGDTPLNYHKDSEQLLAYLRRKAAERERTFE